MDNIMPPTPDDAGSLDSPITAFSLTTVKREMPQLDELAPSGLLNKFKPDEPQNKLTPNELQIETTPNEPSNKLAPKSESSGIDANNTSALALVPDSCEQVIYSHDFQQPAFDFDAIANTYGEDWWQFDMSETDDAFFRTDDMLHFV